MIKILCIVYVVGNDKNYCISSCGLVSFDHIDSPRYSAHPGHKDGDLWLRGRGSVCPCLTTPASPRRSYEFQTE